MSEHEHERLSAYLDGELPPDERSAVAAHIAACPECAARLAEFAAVDEAAAALAASAPGGYFEALPGRMRARLEPRRSGTRRLPVWTWAAAAALLLAVVTPLTLSRRPALQAPAPVAQAPAAAPPAAPPPATVPSLRLDDSARAQAAPPAAPAVETPARLKREAVPPPSAPAAAPPAPQRSLENAAPKPDEHQQAAAGFAEAPTDADRARSEPAREGRRDSALAASGLPAAGALSRAVPVQPRDEAATVAAEEEADRVTRRPAAPPTEPKADDVIALTEGPQPGKAVQQKDAAGDQEWRRLQAVRPQTVAEWRRLRDELRRFADAAPEGPHADAARLRTIEVGYTAWRSGGDAADEAVFRRDAAAYLERGEDAKSKPLVRRLLR